MEPHLSPQGTIKAHSSQPLGPLHKPDPPLVVFLCMYLGDSQSLTVKGLLSYMKKQERLIAVGTGPSRSSVASPSPQDALC